MSDLISDDFKKLFLLMSLKNTNDNAKKVSQGEPDPGLITDLLENLAKKKGNLITILQGVQNIYGYIPESIIRFISDRTGHPVSSIYGVATFYSQFRLHPAGKYTIRVCHGTACHVQDSDSVSLALKDELKTSDGETTEDGLFTLETVACLGCCSLAPVMMIGEETFGNLTPGAAVKIVKGIRRREGGDR